MEYLTCGSCKQWRLFGISYPAQLGFILATNSYFCLSISHCLCLYMKNKAFVIYFLFFSFFLITSFSFYLSLPITFLSIFFLCLHCFTFFLSFFFLHFLFFVLLSTNIISSTLTYLYFRRYEKLM